MKVVNGVQIVTLEINPQIWQIIQAGLNELPRKISEDVLQHLTQQVKAQTVQPGPSSAAKPAAGVPAPVPATSADLATQATAVKIDVLDTDTGAVLSDVPVA